MIGLLLIYSFFPPTHYRSEVCACYEREALVSDTARYSFIDMQRCNGPFPRDQVTPAVINAVMNIGIGPMGTCVRLKPSGSVFQVSDLG